MTAPTLQPVGAEGYLANLHASIDEGVHSKNAYIRSAVREMILHFAERIRHEREEEECPE